MATTYLTRAMTASATGKEQWTLSMWVKRSGISATQYLFNAYSDTNNYTGLYFDSNDKLFFTNTVGGSDAGTLQTNRVFRDTNAWYSIVVVWDSNNGSAGDRMKMYINGVEETSFATDTNPSSGQDSYVGDTPVSCLLGHKGEASFYFNGMMSHIHFADSSALAPTVFGSVDATSGEWKMNTSPSVTYGTNGFFILKNGNSVTDQSGEGNNWTVGAGTLTNLEDCPDNVFCTLNPLESRTSSGTAYPAGFSNVNNTTNFYTDNATTKGVIATFAPSAGKYYWELKVVLSGPEVEIGVAQGNYTGTNYGGNPAKFNFWQYQEDGTKGLNRGSWASYGNSWTTGDFLSFALDCGTGTIWAAKNGTWQNSATTAEISAGTTTNAMFTGMDNTWGFLPAQVMYDANGSNITLAYNFGNGCFEATQLSGTTYKGSGDIGIFKYNIIPTGYTALSTKGLQE